MSSKLPPQAFQIGQRVRHMAGEYFIIGVIYIDYDLTIRYARNSGIMGFTAASLTLAPERLPYVPSARLVVVTDCDHTTRIAYYQRYCRCETDAEMAERHAVERAEYDRQVCDYPICSTRGAGHPLACNCLARGPL